MPWNDVVAQMKRRQMAQPAPSPYSTVEGVQGAEDAQIASQTGYGERATGDYLNRAEGFDASTALNKYAQGAWGNISAGLKQTLADTRGQSVGAGRFDSGFLDEDQGTVINRATSAFSNDLAQQSVAAAGMDQRNTEQIGNFANERTSMGNDLLAGRSEQVQNDARAEAERKRKKRAGIGGLIGGVIGAGAGALTGNPLAVSGGWKAGSSVGSGIGGW